MIAYKFLRDDMRSGSGKEPAWKVGETRLMKGRLKLCSRGYHFSPSWFDALGYAKGDIACVVDVSAPVDKDASKQVSSRCTIISAHNIEGPLRIWACDCAERALKVAKVTDKRSWNAIKVARLFAVGEATREDLATAKAAAWDASKAAAWDAARDAAWDAARAATWDAARDAAWDAARTAAWDASRAAAWDAARDAAWDAEIDWQRQHLHELIAPLFVKEVPHVSSNTGTP